MYRHELLQFKLRIRSSPSVMALCHVYILYHVTAADKMYYNEQKNNHVEQNECFQCFGGGVP